MIKLTHIERAGDRELLLRFSDGSEGVWNAADIIAHNTSLTAALADSDFFDQAFVDEGALSWPNGLDLAGHALHQELAEKGLLRTSPSEPKDSIVTLSELHELNVNELLTNSENATDAYDISTVMRAVAAEAESSGDIARVRAASFLQAVCSIHATPEQRERPYGPMIVMDGRRSAIPDDFIGDQTGVIAEFATQVTNSALRARLADIAWLNNRRDRNSAGLAIESYIRLVELAVANKASSRFGHDKAYDFNALNNLRRALDIARASRRTQEFASRLAALMECALAAAIDDKEDTGYCRVARMAAEYQLLNLPSIGEHLLDRGKELSRTTLHDAEIVLETAITVFAAVRNEERRRDAAIALAELRREMARGSNRSPMVGAHFLERALAALHGSRNVRELRTTIISELRSLQVNMEEEMGVISGPPVDIGELRERVTEHFRNRSFIDALLAHVSLERSPEPETLLAEARKIAAQSPLSSLFAGKSLDGEGRTVAHHVGTGFDSDNDEAFGALIARHESIRINLAVASTLEPARLVLVEEHPSTVEELVFLCSRSPSVKPGHEYTVARGIYYYLLGDTMLSAALLFPQIETILRHLLTLSGFEPSTIDGEGVQERVGLPTLLGKFRDALIKILSYPIYYEVGTIFNTRLGPSLRHEHAHGNMGSSAYYSDMVLYACWFITKLVLLPLRPHQQQIEREYQSRFANR